MLVFALYRAFAGPLLKLAGQDSCSFHLFGNSSRGKTTALQVVASVWGRGADASNSELSHIRTRRQTEALAAAYSDGLLPLGEMGMFAGADFGRAVYLAGGQGKSRMNNDATLKGQSLWRIAMLSTGEVSVRDKIEEGGGAAKTG